MTRREELHPWIVAMRAEGVTWREIAERLGLAISTVQDYGTDPDGAKVRARKERSDAGEPRRPLGRPKATERKAA